MKSLGKYFKIGIYILITFLFYKFTKWLGRGSSFRGHVILVIFFLGVSFWFFHKLHLTRFDVKTNNEQPKIFSKKNNYNNSTQDYYTKNSRNSNNNNYNSSNSVNNQSISRELDSVKNDNSNDYQNNYSYNSNNSVSENSSKIPVIKDSKGNELDRLKREFINRFDKNGVEKTFSITLKDGSKRYFRDKKEILYYCKLSGFAVTLQSGKTYFPSGTIENPDGTIDRREMSLYSSNGSNDQDSYINNYNNSQYESSSNPIWRQMSRDEMESQNQEALRELNREPRNFSHVFSKSELSFDRYHFLIYFPDGKSYTTASTLEEMRQKLSYQGLMVLMSTENGQYPIYYSNGASRYFSSTLELYQYVINNDLIIYIKTCWNQSIIDQR